MSFDFFILRADKGKCKKGRRDDILVVCFMQSEGRYRLKRKAKARWFGFWPYALER